MDKLNLYVYHLPSGERVPVQVLPATSDDLASTIDWQTKWTSKAVRAFPNKVALKRSDDGELLGLMSFRKVDSILAVEIVYLENAAHSNANLLREKGADKKYLGIAKALNAYAIQVSLEAGYEGVLVFKAKSDKLLEYYMSEFGAKQVGRYDPYRLVIWEDEAHALLSSYMGEENLK